MKLYPVCFKHSNSDQASASRRAVNVSGAMPARTKLLHGRGVRACVGLANWHAMRACMCAAVVRKGCLYQPNSFGFLVPKPCKTAKFFNPLNVFPMSPVFVTTPFLVQKALKTTNSEKCVFRVRRQMCCLGLQIRSFSAENLLQVFAVLRNPFSSPKNLELQPAELVTADVTGL